MRVSKCVIVCVASPPGDEYREQRGQRQWPSDWELTLCREVVERKRMLIV